MSQLATESWAPTTTDLQDGGTGSLAEIAGASGRVLMAEARIPTVEGTIVASARLEYGEDGVTLPRRVVAARALLADPARMEPAVGVDSDGGAAIVTSLVQPAASLLAPGVTADPDPRAWVMDPGLPALVASGSPLGSPGVMGLAAGIPLAAALTGDAARQPETPALVIGDRSAPVDARGLGDIYAVILAGTGGIDLEGTVVHGAVFTEGDVRVGETGMVLFRKGVWAWATEHSLVRVRLVRGTRTESFEPATP